jgi:mono/diheme cytochrome c family protein
MKIFKYLNLLLLSTFAVVLGSCYYDNEEELYPQPVACDTTNVTYAGTVNPILDQECLSCHSGGAPSAGIRLETYDDIAAAAAIPEGTFGSLLGVIKHSIGNSPMPKGGNKLSDCKIQQIEKWINEGALNN